MRHGVPAARGALLTFLVALPAALPAAGQDGGFESACHEGNYGLTGILSGARAMERNGLAGSK